MVVKFGWNESHSQPTPHQRVKSQLDWDKTNVFNDNLMHMKVHPHYQKTKIYLKID